VRSEVLARVRRAFAEVLRREGYVSVVHVLVEMKRLTPARLEDWRFGRVPYLERVVQGSLSELTAIGQEVRRVGREHGLKPTFTAYRKWGKGPKPPLRFSKSGRPSIEEAYATHWVSRQGAKRPERPAGTPGPPPVDAFVPPPSRGNGDTARVPAGEGAGSGKRSRTVLQPGVAIVRDPGEVRRLADERGDENAALRVFLKTGPVPSRVVDRLFHRLNDEVGAETTAPSAATAAAS
jgi:hypothetical protein